jgi:predicted nucleotidyltransferase
VLKRLDNKVRWIESSDVDLLVVVSEGSELNGRRELICEVAK